MKILVTGANGLLGQRIIANCLANDITVLATSKGESRLYDLKGADYQSMDITNPDSIHEVFSAFKPTAVINTAALTHVDQCDQNKALAEAINVDGVRHLASYCEAHTIYLCHVSTDFIFDGTKGELYDEDDVPNPVNFYGETKLRAEEVLHGFSDLKCSILRTILVFGFVPNLTRTNIILWLNETLAKGGEVSMVTDQFRTPTFADDLAQACINACKRDAQGVFNVSGPDYLSVFEVAQLVAAVFNHNKNLIKPAESVAFSDRAPRPPKTGFNISKAREELGYTPLLLKEALEKTRLQIQDFKNNS